MFDLYKRRRKHRMSLCSEKRGGVISRHEGQRYFSPQQCASYHTSRVLHAMANIFIMVCQIQSGYYPL